MNLEVGIIFIFISSLDVLKPFYFPFRQNEMASLISVFLFIVRTFFQSK